jgi:sodium transport system permease protein
MHWSIIQLIWLRELRDLIRDRRTVFMIFLLPVALYPLLGVVGLTFALGKIEQKSVVGVHGLEYLPQVNGHGACSPAVPAAAWLSLSPASGRGCGGVESVAGAAGLSLAVQTALEYPPLTVQGRIPDDYGDLFTDPRSLRIVEVASGDRSELNGEHADRPRIDVLLVVPPDFRSRLDSGGRAVLDIFYREGDERSRLADRRLQTVLTRWQHHLKAVRFLRLGLPLQVDQPLEMRRPQHEPGSFKHLTDELSGMLARFFPFLLIMWALAGALHPAIDLMAGEKERSTLEPLLLTPATRGEIVCGKFMAVWSFSSATALWNLIWLGGAAWLASLLLSLPLMRLAGLIWCAVLTILLAALFSAVSLGLGAFARSTKEGQYYLLPIFVITMPLTFLPLVPGVDLNWFYSLVPITGATLLLQKLLEIQPDGSIWIYFGPVVFSLAVCIGLSLRWAVAQMHREEVLFREAEGMDFLRGIRRLLGRQGFSAKRPKT